MRLLILLFFATTCVAQVSPGLVYTLPTPKPVLSFKGSQVLKCGGAGIASVFSASIEVDVNLVEGQPTSYFLVKEKGAGILREKVLNPALTKERNPGRPNESSFTEENYVITYEGEKTKDDLFKLSLKPRRLGTDNLLEGFLFIRPDGELVRVEGKPGKSFNPSLEINKITIWYLYIDGARVPSKMLTDATYKHVPATFSIEYHYDILNGKPINQH